MEWKRGNCFDFKLHMEKEDTKIFFKGFTLAQNLYHTHCYHMGKGIPILGFVIIRTWI